MVTAEYGMQYASLIELKKLGLKLIPAYMCILELNMKQMSKNCTMFMTVTACS